MYVSVCYTSASLCLYTHTQTRVCLSLYMGILGVYSNLEGKADIGSYFQVRSKGCVGDFGGGCANGK